MFKILLISHGNLAQEILNTSKMIMGEQEGITALGLKPDEGNEEFGNKIFDTCSKLYSGSGILILTDLYGGTPCNTAILRVMNKFDNVEILAGVNLAMVLEALVSRDMPLSQAVTSLKEAGKNGIYNIKEMMKENCEDE